MTLIEFALTAAGALMGFIVTLLGWVGSGYVAKFEKLSETVNTQVAEVAVLKSGVTPALRRLDEHDTRFTLLDSRLGEILSTLAYLRAMLESDHQTKSSRGQS